MFELPPMFGGGGENVWDEPDIVLTYIITALVNGMGLEMGATLMARGLVISGTLTSEKAYLDNISDMLMRQVQFDDESVPEEVREGLKDLLNLRSLAEFDLHDMAATIAEDMDDDDDDFDDMDDIDLPPPVTYIHLKDPVIVAGEPPIEFGEGSNVIIRLRLTTIDGWMLGKISPDAGAMFDFHDDDEIKH
ncbi:MAG: hypothetical protein AAFV33_19650 [Chloroflexota bacterium]